MKLRTLSCQFRNRVSCRNCERRNWHAENTRELEKRVTNCCVTPINNEKSRKKRVVVLNPRSESCGKCHLNCTKTAPSRNVCKCVCFLLVPNKMVALIHGSLRFVPASKGVSIMGPSFWIPQASSRIEVSDTVMCSRSNRNLQPSAYSSFSFHVIVWECFLANASSFQEEQRISFFVVLKTSAV